MPWLKSTAPFVTETILETNTNPQPIDVTVFDFKTQLLSLLNDKMLFGNIENLDIDPQNPFGPYKAPDDILSAVNSGMRYRNAYKLMIKKTEKEFLLPIIFACDETQVSKLGKTTAWPLYFSTSILNQSMRNKPIAWRPLGYIPNLKLLTSANQENNSVWI